MMHTTLIHRYRFRSLEIPGFPAKKKKIFKECNKLNVIKSEWGI
jgi:hypothetical protein